MYLYIMFGFLFNLFYTFAESQKVYTMLKQIGGDLYLGGKNFLEYRPENNSQKSIVVEYNNSFWTNLEDTNFDYVFDEPKYYNNVYSKGLRSLAFDNCLNWREEHPDPKNREYSFDYQRLFYHTPKLSFKATKAVCKANYIKAVELYDDNTLWVCATFGSFPKAFLVHLRNLTMVKNREYDSHFVSCARYPEEPMASISVSSKDGGPRQIITGSGWGLYRPHLDKGTNMVNNVDSTMLYADWRIYRNLFTLPAAMAWVLSSDVNFINVVKETNDHLYFFGFEVNNQYGLHNQDDRNAWQSFMVRICKSDPGFRHLPTNILKDLDSLTANNYQKNYIGGEEYKVTPAHLEMSYNKKWYQTTMKLPQKHFMTAQKINFGCYLGKRPRAISDNHFWGDVNVVYFNRMADVIYDPNRELKFTTKSYDKILGCDESVPHHQIPLMGVFNSAGISGSAQPAAGALCQLQINQNIFTEHGTNRPRYHKNNVLDIEQAHDEVMLTGGMSYSNFYSRSMHRTNGLTLFPYWNQGVYMGHDKSDSYKNKFRDVGRCRKESDSPTIKHFLNLMNLSNTAWPSELGNRLTSRTSAVCQFPPAELYSFNATFVMPNREFKKLFVLKQNITNYFMPKIEPSSSSSIRSGHFSPIMVVLIITDAGEFLRVVLCDFDSAIENRGTVQPIGDVWKDWCIFRHTDQPYLYRQYAPMENRRRNVALQFRASSLLRTFVPDKYDNSRFVDAVKKDSVVNVLFETQLLSVTLTECQYKSCVECASDPDCAWDMESSSCTSYQTGKNQENFVQDVLDRGFRCAINRELGKSKSEEVAEQKPLICADANFWRGDIEWSSESDGVIKPDNPNYLVNSSSKGCSLLIIRWRDDTVQCYGLIKDKDKLFNGSEYKWILEWKKMEKIFLKEFKLKKSKCSIWCIVAIILVILVICLIPIAIWSRRIKKEKPDRR